MKQPLQQVQSLDRGLTILCAVANSDGPVSLGELTSILGINRSSVFRLAATLKRRGFLASPFGRKNYVLGPSIWRLSEQYNWGGMLIQMAHDQLKNLALETNETARLAVREGTQTHVIDHAEASHAVAVSGRAGTFYELHCSSLGKALLTDATDQELKALYGSRPLHAYTENTITSVKELVRVCAQTRKNGYAVDLGEFRDDLCCVAAPIRAADGAIVAAIGISAPSSRFSEVQCRQHAKVVTRFAAEISESLKNIDELAKPTPPARVALHVAGSRAALKRGK